MFRMLYVWSGNSHAEYYIEDNVPRSYLYIWNHLWNSCQKLSMKMRLCIWSIELFMEKLALMFSFLAKAKLAEALCVALFSGGSVLLRRHFWALRTQILKRHLHGPWDLVSDWLELPARRGCASCVSFWIVAGWQAWRAHSPPENALCQVSTLLQRPWCPHPSLLPPWARTAWVPWTWGPCREASTPLAHVEPWWGGDWERKTSKAHVSEMSTNVFWPEQDLWVHWHLGCQETYRKSVLQEEDK